MPAIIGGAFIILGLVTYLVLFFIYRTKSRREEKAEQRRQEERTKQDIASLNKMIVVNGSK